MNQAQQTLKRKILIVEDESIFLELLAEKFINQDFEVYKALNGKEALDIAKKELPDVIITDLTMPVMNGIEFIKELRSRDKWGKDVFVIILSNRGDMDSIADTIDLGAHHYFVKADVDPNKVVESVIEFTSSLS